MSASQISTFAGPYACCGARTLPFTDSTQFWDALLPTWQHDMKLTRNSGIISISDTPCLGRLRVRRCNRLVPPHSRLGGGGAQ